MKMKLDVWIIFFLFLFSISCNNIPKIKTAEELKQELLTKETSTPLLYLSVDANMNENKVVVQKGNFFHHSKLGTDGWIINGVIKNTASLAKFKDVVVEVTFYTQTKTAIEAKDFIIYKYFDPHSSVPFELKVFPPDTMNSFGITIKKATSVN